MKQRSYNFPSTRPHSQLKFRIMALLIVCLHLVLLFSAHGNALESECGSTALDPSIDLELRNDGKQLECEVMAVPPASIDWFLDGRPITDVNDNTGFGLEELENAGMTTFGLAVTQSRLSQPCPGGEYTCVAHNRCSTKNASLAVGSDILEGDCLDSNEAPNIWLWTSERMECEDAAVQLICRAKGEPKPEIHWFEESEGGEYGQLRSNQNRTILANGDLLVFENIRGGALSFKCVAKNRLGIDSREMVIIQVILD